MERVNTYEGQEDYVEWARVISLDIEKKSRCGHMRRIMSHQGSVLHQRQCESGEINTMMVQTLFEADEFKCMILGTTIELDRLNTRDYVTGTRTGTKPEVVASRLIDGCVPGLARDRECTLDVLIPGTNESNFQFIMARIAEVCLADRGLTKDVENLASVSKNRRPTLHQVFREMEESCERTVIEDFIKILITTLYLEFLADNHSLWAIAENQATFSLGKVGTDAVTETAASPFTRPEYCSEDLWDSSVNFLMESYTVKEMIVELMIQYESNMEEKLKKAEAEVDSNYILYAHAKSTPRENVPYEQQIQ